MDPVIVTSYDPGWKRQFEAIGRKIRESLGPVADRIDHIGSTSIPGMAAKPILDIQVSVRALEPAHRYASGLRRLGFVFRAQNPDRSKRYFREPPGMERMHVHVRATGSWSEQFSLLFRDYLRAHPVECERLSVLKRDLAKKYADDRLAYGRHKGPAVWEIMERATEWSQQIGWAPGPSDA